MPGQNQKPEAKDDDVVRARLTAERARDTAKLLPRRRESEAILSELRLLLIVGSALSDDDLYDRNGLPS